MAALAYVLLPLSGVIAFLLGEERTRKHGLQAIELGLVWGLGAYVGSWIGPGVTRAVFVAGALVWLTLIAVTAAGRDLWLPGSRRLQGLLES